MKKPFLHFECSFWVFVMLAALVFAGCETFKRKPPPALPAPVPQAASPVSSSVSSLETRLKEGDAAAKVLEAKTLFANTKIRSIVDRARAENGVTIESPSKLIIDSELGLVQSWLFGVVPDPEEAAAALARKALVEAGKPAEAAKVYAAAMEAASKSAAEVATLRAERDKAIVERDKAVAAVGVALANYEKQLEANRVANQKAIDDLNTAWKQKLDDEKSEFNKTLGKVLYGTGIALILGAVLMTIFGVKSGDPVNAIIRGLIMAGGGGFCFAVAWTINQPWFKWLVIGGLSCGGIAIGIYLFLEWQEAVKKREAIKRAKEADEAEDTLKRVSNVIDQLPDEVKKPLDVKLRGVMDETNKAVLLELKAEDKRAKAGAGPA